MRTLQIAVIAVVLVVMLGSSARAGVEPVEVREPAPGAAIGAAFCNIVFAPLRFAVTVVNAELGGFTGLMTAGNVDAANDVWGLADGQNMLSPAIMQGKEQLRFGR